MFRAAFDLVPDPVGVSWAIRGAAGSSIDFETGAPVFGETVVESRREPIGRLSGVFMGLFVEQLAVRLERGRDESNEQLVDLLRRADARAKTLVDGILEHARYGTAAEVEAVDMTVLVSDVLASLSAALLDTGAAVDVGRLPTIEGNPAQVADWWAEHDLGGSLMIAQRRLDVADLNGRAHALMRAAGARGSAGPAPGRAALRALRASISLRPPRASTSTPRQPV